MKLVRRGLAVTTTAMLLTCVTATTAHADEPLQQGWWTVANTGVAPAPAPPDVPSDGLLVQGGTQGPSAFAALVYSFSPGSTVGPLTLTIAPNSATSPGAKLEVCPLANGTINADQGGPMKDAPHYNCASKALAS